MAWRVARSLETLRQQFNARYPDRSTASDGGIGDAAHASRSSDHNPWVGPAADGLMLVTARDFTHDPTNGMDLDRLTDELAASRDPRIKYLIGNGLILDSRPGNNPWKWMPYSGSNPHRKHFHISVHADIRLADDPRPWNLPSFGSTPTPSPPTEVDDLTPEQSRQLSEIHHELFGPRGGKGEISGWGTTIGPRTVVAMLVDLHNALLAPQLSRYPDPNSKIKLSAIEAVRNIDGLVFQLPAVINAAGRTDPAAVAEALRPVIAEAAGPVIRDAVLDAIGTDNEDQADAIVDRIAARLAGQETPRV
ncbi:hypothetical protein [Saccharopolyspora sp. NPDC002376]